MINNIGPDKPGLQNSMLRHQLPSIPKGDSRRDIGERYVDYIADVFDPDQIILFGSAARGELGPNSDLNLLVVKDCPSELPFSGEIYKQAPEDLADRDFSIDILVCKPENVPRARASRYSIIGTALREGLVIHSKKPLVEQLSATELEPHTQDTPEFWIGRAQSSLAAAQCLWTMCQNDHMCPVDIGYVHVQNALTHGIKAILVSRDLPFSRELRKEPNLEKLVEEFEGQGLVVSSEIKGYKFDAKKMTSPSEWGQMTSEQMRKILEFSENALSCVRTITEIHE